MRPRYYLILLLTFLFFFGIAKRAFAGGGSFDPPTRNITCYAIIHSDLHPKSGWKRVEAAEQYIRRAQAAAGKIKIQRRETLLCNEGEFNNKGLVEYTAWEWWYK